jgi:hypothetical protein
MREVVVTLILGACWTEAVPELPARRATCHMTEICACIRGRILDNAVDTIRRRIDETDTLDAATLDDPIVIDLPPIHDAKKEIIEDETAMTIRTCLRARDPADACAATRIRCTK